MEAYKLHTRIGQHEFLGEGPVEVVKADYQQFLIFIENRNNEPQRSSERPEVGEASGSGTNADENVDLQLLTQIFKSDETTGVVSLRALPPGENGNRAADAALLLMFGYSKLQSASEVPVTKLLEGLRESGLAVERFDRTISVHNGLYLKGGQKIGARYRLNNPGQRKAAQMVRTMLG